MKKQSKEQLESWKKKYGQVYAVEVGNYLCYLKPPTRQILSLSMSYESSDPLKADESLLQNCWIGGDEEIKTDLNLFLSIRPQLSELFELKKSKLTKH